jgi:hypothetical protein
MVVSFGFVDSQPERHQARARALMALLNHHSG